MEFSFFMMVAIVIFFIAGAVKFFTLGVTAGMAQSIKLKLSQDSIYQTGVVYGMDRSLELMKIYREELDKSPIAHEMKDLMIQNINACAKMIITEMAGHHQHVTDAVQKTSQGEGNG